MATLSLETIRNEININAARVGIEVPEVAIEQLHDIHVKGKNVSKYEFTYNGVDYVFIGANFKITGVTVARITRTDNGELITTINIKH